MKTTIKSFSSFIAEDINIVNGELIFNGVDGIKTSFGKGSNLVPFTKKIPGTDMTSYSLYQAKKATPILKAIKSANIGNDPSVDQFINRSAVYATRILRGMGVDIIVSPVSSSSLTKEFAKQIQQRTNYDFYLDSFRKTADMSRISIDRDDPRITDSIINSMEKIIAKAREKGFISVKQFAPQHRKFITNLFEIIDEQLYNKVNEKNVVIIDDIMTSGTTVKQIYDQLKMHGANNIITLTMFKSSS